MLVIFQRISLFLELFVNGSFILFSILLSSQMVPGFLPEALVSSWVNLGTFFVPVVLSLVIVFHFLSSIDIEDFLRRYVFSLVVLIPLLITWGDHDFAFWLSSAHLLSSLLAFYDERKEVKVQGDAYLKTGNFFDVFNLNPAQLIFLAYFSVILIGTLLLLIPFASSPDHNIRFIDAFFTASSALCITGLVTLPVHESFSLFGQIVILALIQIGGISIMALYSSMIILLGRSMGMKDRIIMQDVLDVSNTSDLFEMIIDIVKFTFIIELWGAILLTIGFTFEGHEFTTALYLGTFHSISAFCQAGFTLFSNSFEDYATSSLINTTIIILMSAGGLGFIVLKELSKVIVYREKIMDMGLHSKVTIITSLILTVASFFMIFFGEFLYALDGYSLWEQIQISLFQAVTTRSAGLNTVAISDLQVYTIYAITLFMFIGGGSGSCAGGIKVTTFAIMAQSVISTLKGEKNVQLLDRKIPGPIVVRAIAITFLYLSVLSAAFFLLVLVERDQPFLLLFFEAISATGTVGLSLGVTEYLSSFSKALLSLVMVIGRIGPLTLIVAISQQSESKGKFDYPDGRIMIG